MHFLGWFKYLIFFNFLFFGSFVWAALPPPPVNQNIGIPDTSFNFLDVSLCKSCHHASQNNEEPLNGAPVKRGLNANRHHLSIGEPIDGVPEYPPFRDADGDGVNDSTFSCLNCHLITGNSMTGTVDLTHTIVFNYRNCFNCHKRKEGDTTVHHATEQAQQGNCFQCHGGIVRGIDVETLEGKRPDPDNPGKTLPVRIADYRIGLVTPWPSNKPLEDSSKVSSAGTHPGNCNFCHNTADGLTQGTIEPFPLADGSTVSVKIFTNEQNHHNTGFFNEGKCRWCHDLDAVGNVLENTNATRVCQRCHDISTLHNIEFDAVGDGIIPFEEAPNFGHIGHNDNCWGCHGFTRDGFELSNQSVAYNGATGVIIPLITSLSQNTVTSGEDTLITIKGSGFTNEMTFDKLVTDENGDPAYETMRWSWKSQVVLTDKEGNITAIEPISQDANTLEFLLPGSQPIGFYNISLKKSYQTSNPVGLIITPEIRTYYGFIYSPYGALVVLVGKGFMELGHFSANGQNGFNLVDQNGTPPVRLYLWHDNLIVAQFSEYPEKVTVTNLFDEQEIFLGDYF